MTADNGILGVILAGGASQRFGADKALAQLAGMPLVEHVVRRARPQVAALALSLGPGRLGILNLPVIVDREPGEGPLSGILSSLIWAEASRYEHIAVFPCDGPVFPSDLVSRLAQALGGFDCVMAACGDDRLYTYGLWRVACLPRVSSAFAGGHRSLRGMADVLSLAFVDFPHASFFNVNRPEDLARAAELLAKD